MTDVMIGYLDPAEHVPSASELAAAAEAKGESDDDDEAHDGRFEEEEVRGLVLFMNKAADVSGTSWTPHAHSHRKSPIVVTSVMVWHVSLRSAISPSMLLTSCSWSPSSFLQEHLSVPPPHGGQTEFCMMYIRKVAPTELARCMRSCVYHVSVLYTAHTSHTSRGWWI